MSRIIIPSSTGECFGVKHAIRVAVAEKTHIAGPVVHNEYTVKRLMNMGIKVYERDESAQDLLQSGVEHVVLTAHGTAPQRINEMADAGIRMTDAVCPILSDIIHPLVPVVQEAGFTLILFGNPEHAEIKGTHGYAKKGHPVYVVYSEEDVGQLPDDLHRIFVMTQTTINPHTYNLVKGALMKRFPRLEVLDSREHPDLNALDYRKLQAKGQLLLQLTKDKDEVLAIYDCRCFPVLDQQEGVDFLGRHLSECSPTGAMVIIGGASSSNTRSLHTVARAYLSDNVFLIHDPSEVDTLPFDGVKDFGVGGGTSTPAVQVIEVIERIAHRTHVDEYCFADRPGTDFVITPLPFEEIKQKLLDARYIL